MQIFMKTCLFHILLMYICSHLRLPKFDTFLGKIYVTLNLVKNSEFEMLCRVFDISVIWVLDNRILLHLKNSYAVVLHHLTLLFHYSLQERNLFLKKERN